MSAKNAPGTTISPPAVLDKPFNVIRALTLRQKGLTYNQIADLMDEPKSTVYFKLNQLSQAIDNPQELQDYREQRTNLLDVAEERFLRSVLDEETIQKASLRDRIIAFGTVFDKRRLESGQSTQNLGILSKIVSDAHSDLFQSGNKTTLKTQANSDTQEKNGGMNHTVKRISNDESNT